MRRARTIVLNPSHWHFPLYIERIAALHDVVGMSDPDPSRMPNLAPLSDVPVYASWQVLLEAHPDAELAYVFLPHDTMRDACLALVALGIPIVVEKPAGTSLQHVSEIRQAAEAASVPVAVPLVQRGAPVERWLAKAGSAVYESAQFIAGPPDRYLTNGSPWMVDGERSGGGCMINLAPHFVDLFLHSTGAQSVTVTAALSATLHHRGIEDFASLTLTTTDARVATIQVGYAFPGSPLKRYCSYFRVGTLGAASISSDGTATFTSVDGRTESDLLEVDSDPLYAGFVEKVAEQLEQGFEDLPGIRDLERTMKVIWDAYSYGRTRRTDERTLR
jgi:predicted dehydrogenase